MQRKTNLVKSTFFTYSWSIDEDETERTVIRIYGLNENNENTCVIVSDFTPYAYIELPENIQWDNSKAQLVVSKINDLLQDQKPLKSQLMFKKRLYYANLDNKGNKKLYPYLFCSFSHVKDIKDLSYKIKRPHTIAGIGAINFKIHEHNASPVLQLTSVRKIPTAGWVEFSGRKIDANNQTTWCTHEYSVSWRNMDPIVKNTVARPLMMSYDLEVNSTDPSSMPQHERPGDKIFQCSCVFSRQGSKAETYEKYILTLGKIREAKQDPAKQIGKSDMLEGVKIIECDTETDLLLAFTKLIKEKQPNILMGYNIFTFDIPYMIDRAKFNFCIYDFDRQGMNKNGHAKEKTIEWSSSAYKNQCFSFLEAEGRIVVDLLPIVRRDQKLSSYSLKTVASLFLPKGMTKDPLDAKGIFKCYRLGMEGGEKGRKALSICAKYCIKDSELVLLLFEVFTTWFALCEMSQVTNVPIFSLYTQGQQLKVFSQTYRKCTHENTVVEKDAYVTKDDDRYIGATVFPPIPGVYDKVVPFDFSSLYPTTMIAYNICWSTLVTDDSIPDEKCHNMEWDEHFGCVHDPNMIKKEAVVEKLKEKEKELKELRKERDKKSNKHRKDEFKLLISNFLKSMKPLRDEKARLQKTKPKHISCCKRKFRWLKSPMGVLPEILTHLLDTRSATKKEMKKEKELLKEMKKEQEKLNGDKVKNKEKIKQLEIAIEEKTIYIDVLDQRQLALKVSANSGYGCLGTRKGYLPLLPGAMATTYMGRKAIEKAAEAIQKQHGGVLIYGDTDSNYISFPKLKTAQECWDYSVKVASEVSKLFPKPMSLAYEEKVYWRFFIITKKRYMSLTCDRDGKMDKDISKKGVLLQRRDNCQFVRHVYERVIMMVFNKEKESVIEDYILEQYNKLCTSRSTSPKDGDESSKTPNSFDISFFTVTKSVGNVEKDEDGILCPKLGKDKDGKECYKIGDYKVKLLPEDEDKREKQFKLKNCDTASEYYLRCLPAQAQLAEKMRARGQFVSAGSRIEYVITTNGGHTAKQYMKIESLEYFQRHSVALEIDYMYYLKQIANPMDQVLDIIFKRKEGAHAGTVGFALQQYKFRLQKSKMIAEYKKLISPIKIINK
jgi:DNA polymerase elongation subunit (family B)